MIVKGRKVTKKVIFANLLVLSLPIFDYIAANSSAFESYIPAKFFVPLVWFIPILNMIWHSFQPLILDDVQGDDNATQ